MAFSMMSARQNRSSKKPLKSTWRTAWPDWSRFRVNVFQQRGNVGLVLRVIPTKFALDELYLPKSRGAGLRVYLAGWCGHGRDGLRKSTTLAAMVDRVNATRAEHIITIEDPSNSCTATEGLRQPARNPVDTPSFSAALRASLRQDPDVILVGEMRDLETIGTRSAAETGHMVFSTLHTLDAVETINRIIAVFRHPNRKQVRLQLAAILRAIIDQRLVRRRPIRRTRARS
jgi:twitching motility protein PilT